MSYFDDLSPNTYFGRAENVLVSIGWLADSHEYVRGKVSTDFFRGLVRLLVDPWQLRAVAGREPCRLCRFSGGPGTLLFEGSGVQLGATNLFVPAEQGKRVFVAPSLIAHYVDAHDYTPPEEFQKALLVCPPMNSPTYLKALLERGLGARTSSL